MENRKFIQLFNIFCYEKIMRFSLGKSGQARTWPSKGKSAQHDSYCKALYIRHMKKNNDKYSRNRHFNGTNNHCEIKQGCVICSNFVAILRCITCLQKQVLSLTDCSIISRFLKLGFMPSKSHIH